MEKKRREEFGFIFRNWKIYLDARSLRKEVNQILKRFPQEEKFALVDQMKRALNSILLNLAEGSSKSSDKETCLYINRAHCSLDEVVSCFDCCLDDNYISSDLHYELIIKAENLAKQLNSFSGYLKRIFQKEK